MEKTSKNSSLNEDLTRNLDKLTRHITYTVLVAFLILLTIILIKALFSYSLTGKTETGEEWLKLFRDGFLILSGILSTLIGYYFGNRGSDAALKQVEEIKKENQKLLENLRSLSPTDEDQDTAIEAFGN